MATNTMPEEKMRNGKISIEGVVSLLLTPFQPDGAIDWNAYDQYVDWQSGFGPSALFAVCGSSEMKWLSLDERLALASRASQRAGSLPVLATANLNEDVSTHRDEISRMVEAGVTGVVLIPRPELAPDTQRYIEYFLEMAEQTPIPVFLYEWPQVERYTLDQQIVAAVSPFMSGIKDTTCTLEGITAKLKIAGEMVVYQANTPYLLDAVDAGARGCMAITSTCFPDLVLDLWRALDQGDNNLAMSLHQHLVVLDCLLVRAYPKTAKYIMRKRGLPIELHTRWPVDLNAEYSKAIDVWMQPGVPTRSPYLEQTSHHPGG